MASINLLYKSEYVINGNLKVMIPTLRSVMEDEDSYYGMVSLLTSMPIDMMVELDSAGIDFTSISSYDLFLMVFESIKNMDTSLIFGDLDLTNFELDVDEEKGKITLLDVKDDIRIGRYEQEMIAQVLRKIHHLEKNRRKPANKEAYQYMLERAKLKRERNKHKHQDSQTESLIISMVNTEQFKYNFESVLDLSIYQFNESVRQIIHKVDYNNIMRGVYAGTIDANKINKDSLNWLVCK